MSTTHARAIRAWLYAVAALVVLMVVVGGLTRLTDSGLSIVEWRPVTGAVPPLTASGWATEFQKYRASPEYQRVNRGMSLDAFKRIYWWEWGHRFLGRLIGAAFLLPLLFLQWRGLLDPRLKRRLWLIFALGGAQGAIGWWMVASGLVDRVDVAHERLAVHLAMACLILVAILWTAHGLAPAGRPAPARLRHTATAILALVFVQIAAGGLVAGLKAGLIYDTWPLMDGAIVPSGLLFLDPPWRNLLDNHLTVQFVHRMLAYALVALAVLHAIDCMRRGAARHRRAAGILLAAILLQAALGIATLLLQVPFAPALLHQALAIVVLILATVHRQSLQAPARRAAGAVPALAPALVAGAAR
jgi:cytochrome c oxidase assembly protein subunit 15